MDVALAGLGRMGRALAARLAGQGHALTVWNRSPGAASEVAAEHGATVAADLAGLWAPGRAVITFLADDPAVEEVCDGLIADAPDGGLLVEMSTISASASARVAQRAAAAGVRYLRAPVSGNPSVIAAGNLGIMVSGARADFDAAHELLLAIGPNVFYLGEGEHARVMKLALNAMLGGTTQLLAETIALGEASGLDRADMLDVINGSAMASPFVGYKTQALVDRDYTATFSTDLLAKDIGLALEAAAAVDVPMPVAAEVLEATRDTSARGLGELDFLALLPRLQSLAGREPDVPVSGGVR
jgi:3-hydroxyisobutyrate dehydrogenase-like beta-hydroxyacid dehydrogenase